MIVIFVFILVLILGSLVNSYYVYELYSYLGVLILSASIIIYISTRYKKFADILLSAFFVRIAILFIDYYKILPIIGSGSDSEYFYLIAAQKARGVLSVDYLTNYTVFLTYLFKLIGPQRLFAQFINVLCSFGTIIYILKSINLSYSLTIKNKRRLVFLAAFTPQVVFFSGILLREAIITLFLSISVYYFIRYFIRRRLSYLAFVFGSILICAYFHSGMIMGLLAYAGLLMIYDNEKKQFVVSFSKIFSLLLVFSVMLIFLLSTSIFTGYFEGILNGEDSEQVMLEKLNYETGAGSAYLTFINFDSPISVVLFLPLKIIYFLFSPMPWDVRNVTDIISFIFESCVVLYLCNITLRNITHKSKNHLCISIFIIFISLTILYSLGTSAAGTAIRHRDTILPVLIVAASFSFNNLRCK